MNAEGQGLGLSFPDLVSPQRWQRLQDHFAEVLGIGLRTVSVEKRLLATPSWPAGLDPQQLTTFFRLGEELEELFPASALPQEIATIARPSGVAFSACPLRAKADRILAYLVVGPVVLGHRESADALRPRATATGLDPNVLWALLLTVKLYSFSNMRSVLKLLEEVGNTLLELSYQAQALRALVSETPKLDDAMAAYYTERLSQSLLETAAAATHAEGGSVMLYDPKQRELRIRAAQGLSEETVASTRLCHGEGLAGIALAEQRMLLLDEHITEDRFKRLMTRRGLTSSLVAPLCSDQHGTLIGVLNLRTSDPERRFTQEHVELLRRLLNLASIALSSLRYSS